ncbi:hypothetical protein ACIRYZ_23195 [Kitasatospora sp. NPDC101155]|uniref:hypothetical protein n=1 Tax=Kitasatospora sp. NPDC101155 TaxID=3364097 RepID=UPI003823F065
MNRSSRSSYQNANSRSSASSRSGGNSFYGDRPVGGRSSRQGSAQQGVAGVEDAGSFFPHLQFRSTSVAFAGLPTLLQVRTDVWRKCAAPVLAAPVVQ